MNTYKTSNLAVAIAILSTVVAAKQAVAAQNTRIESVPVVAPEELFVTSSGEVKAESKARLAWHYKNAARLAQVFAQKEKCTIHRQVLPESVTLFRSPKELAQALNKPESEATGYVVARINLRMGIVYLGRDTPEDLYVELGKWLYYPHGYQWGRDQSTDRRMLALAEKFADFCMNKKNWLDANGSSEPLR